MLYKRLLGAGFAGSMALASGCGLWSESDPFDNREGDIVAEVPTTVQDVWHNERNSGKYRHSGYELFLETEDCPEGQAYEPGTNHVNPACEVETHEVTPETYYDNLEGDEVTWEDAASPSEVHQRLHTYLDTPYYEDVTVFALLVRQCIGGDCVTDFVRVDVDMWAQTEEGEQITFSGEPGEIVSQ